MASAASSRSAHHLGSTAQVKWVFSNAPCMGTVGDVPLPAHGAWYWCLPMQGGEMGSSADILGPWDRGLKQDASQFFPMHLPSGQSALGSPLALCCASLLADLSGIPTALGFGALHFKPYSPAALQESYHSPTLKLQHTDSTRLNDVHADFCLCRTDVCQVRLYTFNSQYTKLWTYTH